MLLRFLLVTVCITQAAAYCPGFLRNQTACSCFDNFDGIVIKCNGPDGPIVVEQLKKTQLEIRELYLENANIVQVDLSVGKTSDILKPVKQNRQHKLFFF